MSRPAARACPERHVYKRAVSVCPCHPQKLGHALYFGPVLWVSALPWQIPVQLEQTLGTAAVVRLGAGLAASCRNPESTAKALRALLESDRHAQAARRFAERYADFDPQKQIEKLLDGVEEILAQRSRSRR